MDRIVTPEERTCERCGRQDVWDEETGSWQIVRDEDGTVVAGRPDCIHEWDITGSFNPIVS